MKVFVLLLAVCAVAAASPEPSMDFNEWQEPSFLQVSEASNPLPDAANVGYIPSTSPFDNAATLASRVPTLPSFPHCTVRPQTVVEVKRMRHNAARIAQMIQTEVMIMEKRKAYIEQMTSYLNDRIRELNKVKGELEQENRWIEVSNQRIHELAQKERLIKMQDIMACLQSDQNRLQGAKNQQNVALSTLQQQAAQLEQSINGIKTRISSINSGVPTHGTTGTGTTGGQVTGTGTGGTTGTEGS